MEDEVSQRGEIELKPRKDQSSLENSIEKEKPKNFISSIMAAKKEI